MFYLLITLATLLRKKSLPRSFGLLIGIWNSHLFQEKLFKNTLTVSQLLLQYYI